MKFIVWCPEMGGTAEWGTCIDAFSPGGAAEVWARREDSRSADYLIVNGNGTTVVVRDEQGKEQEMFVQGERELSYYAVKK